MPRAPRKPLLMGRDEAAALLGIGPDYVRKYLARRGIGEQRGWDPRAVKRVAAAKKNAKTDSAGEMT